MKTIKDVKILPGCISCEACVAACPKVFYVDSISHIKKDVNLQEHSSCIQEAADMCPVQVIKVVWTNSKERNL